LGARGITCQKLGEAETLLKTGFRGLTGCDDRVMALKRKYGI